MFNNHSTTQTEGVRRAYAALAEKKKRKEKQAKTIILACTAVVWAFIAYVVVMSAYDWAKASGLL